ncbi:hypothetical protein BDZ89DRAFT_1138993 [Hymenopellis radicata]|nr:hypothetical protein BDZ89DRAFT_1138993 [Hymenopellis radicata]
MRAALGALVDAEELTGFDVEEDVSILSKVHPPLHVRVTPSPAMLATVAPVTVPTAGPHTTTNSSRVSCPPGLVFFNGYLLKAIGAGLAGKTNTVKSGGK